MHPYHNKKVRMKLYDLRSALSEAPMVVEEAKMLLEEGDELIAKR